MSTDGEPPSPIDIKMSPSPPPTPGAFPPTNGVNGSDENEIPKPPPHKVASPKPEEPPVDAEACKAAGNKFFKAKQYDKAIAEYTKGSSALIEKRTEAHEKKS